MRETLKQRPSRQAPPFIAWGLAGLIVLIALCWAYVGTSNEHAVTGGGPVDQPRAQWNAVPQMATLQRDAVPDAVETQPEAPDGSVSDERRLLFERIAAMPEGRVKDDLVKLTGENAGPETVPFAILALCESNDAGVHRAAERVISRLADSAAVERLVDVYDAAYPTEVRDRVSRTFAAISSEDAVPAIITVLRDRSESPTEQLVRSAINALAAIGNPPAADALLARIDTESSAEGRAVLSAAVAQLENPESADVLSETAAGDNKLAVSSEARAAAVESLSRSHSDPATLSLLQSLRADPDPRVAHAAEWAVKLRRAPSALE